MGQPKTSLFSVKTGIALAILLVGGLVAFGVADLPTSVLTNLSGDNPEAVGPAAALPTSLAEEPTAAAPSPSATKPVATPTATQTRPPTPSATPTVTPTATPSPTPTLDLSKCNAAGCGAEAKPLPTVEYDPDLLLASEPHRRRRCPECPANPTLSNRELDELLTADPATLAQLRSLTLSQESYEIAPGIVYIVYQNAHHVVIDLKESGYVLRNVIPETAERGTLITPSYCYTPDSLVVTNADYHGLNGSNKTETGRDLFFHLGRAALFERNGRFDIDVIRERPAYDRTNLAWGGGPIFLWDGEYNYNPEQEWFEPDDLDYYRDTFWAKMTVALSQDRKYIFLTVSYDLSLEEHAENIISLAETWGMKIDRAMRFDGGESAYMAIRLGEKMVPLLNLEEPLIVNCLAVEQAN